MKRVSRQISCALGLATVATVTVLSGCAPRPSAIEMRHRNALADLEAYRARAPVIDAPLTLEHALDYAVHYNTEAWIAAEESRFQLELATQASLRMLPSLMAGATSQGRSTFDASSSQSLESRKESLEPSFSSEKRSGNLDVSLTWNLLDFGIAYYRAHQQKNRFSIALERERRVQQNLALQVTATYWRAVAAKESVEEAERISEEVSGMLASIRAQIRDQTIDQVEGLRQETSLLERQDELRRFKRDFLKAKTELAKLIGLLPGVPFELAQVRFQDSIDPFPCDIEKLEWAAIRNRPELFEKDMEQAISRDEARIALAQMFPSPAMFFQLNYDSNRFLTYEHWNSVGIRASWDLLSLPQQLKQRDIVKLQTELIAKRRMAVAVAVLTQLHLSLIEVQEAQEQVEVSGTIARKYDMLLQAVSSQAAEGKSHNGACIEQRMKSLKTRAKYLSAYANVMTAHARVLNTIGQYPSHGSRDWRRGSSQDELGK